MTADEGAVFGLADADRIIEAVRWVEMMRGPRQRALVASQRVPASAEPVLVRCTSATPDGDGLYPGIVTSHDGSGWVDADVACKLRMADGSTPTSGARYPARPTAHPTAAAFVAAGPAGSGGLALAEADGSPSYAGVASITVDQADGLSLSQPGGAGTARLDIRPADNLTAGTVTPFSQAFTGDKGFDNASVNGYCAAKAGKGFVVNGGSFADVGTMANALAVLDASSTGVSGADTLGQAIIQARKVVTLGGAASGVVSTLYLDSQGLLLDAAGSPYRIQVSGVNYDGITDTFGGHTFRGGIATAKSYAKGDILAADAANALNKLAVGTDGHVLTADAASANGVKWAAPASGTGTVTTLSVATANGFAGSVANATTTPAITLTTTVTGVLKGDGTAISAAAAGTDYLAPAAIGTTVQAYDSDLAAIAGLTATTDNFIVSVSSAWASRTPAQVRTTLGLAAIATSGSASDLASGTVPTARLGSGTASSTTFLRGDQTWASPDGTPTGAIIMYGGSSAPTGWLVCDGAAVSRTTYAALFSLLSINYGVGDNSTTFNLPDLRQRFPLGYQAGIALLGVAGGSATHTLTTGEMPAHTHTYTAVTATAANPGAGAFTGPAYVTGVASGSAGGGGAHNNMPPYQVVNFIIKT